MAAALPSPVPHAPGAPFVGVLMLDTQFPRPPGDVGNPVTFARLGIPARHVVVVGASPHRAVRAADPALLAPFIATARHLVAQGAGLVTTSCGFLARHQPALARAVPVPVLSSSLLLCRTMVRPGILTIDAASLDAAVRNGAGVPDDVPVQGVADGCEFQRRILGNEPTLDVAQAERDVVDAARALVDRHPDLTDVVLECTNMPPYRDAVAAAVGRPVHDLVTALAARWAALRP